MKKKRIIAIALILVMLLVSQNAWAASFDPAKKGTISLSVKYDGKAVSGGSLTMYRVCDVIRENNADLYFVLTEEFAASGIEIGDLSDENLAADFAQYIKENNISGTTKKIDKNGEIIFEELEPGLYLFVQRKAASGFAKMKPFLVSLPVLMDGEYVYEVNASPKTGIGPQKPKPSDEPDPELPQTGQDNILVPVLASGGILLVVIGICLISLGKKNREN
ncbi:MAG: hypothetical protein J6D00_02680 [Christensenellaceae bacterium]|nr:hypothetical protein [Christensenellaceae bacterium]